MQPGFVLHVRLHTAPNNVPIQTARRGCANRVGRIGWSVLIAWRKSWGLIRAHHIVACVGARRKFGHWVAFVTSVEVTNCPKTKSTGGWLVPTGVPIVLYVLSPEILSMVYAPDTVDAIYRGGNLSMKFLNVIV